MKLFVWDFHGVLEKDNDLAVLEVSNAILKQHGHEKRLTQEENQKYYGLKWYEYFEKLLPDETHEHHLLLQKDCFKYSDIHLDIIEKHIKPNDHALSVLQQIVNAGHEQILLSNTRPNDLIWFVKTVGISEILSGSKIVG